MAISKGLKEFIRNRHFPKIFKEMMYCYLNSLDYIVVANKNLEQKLRNEGVRKPQFYEMPKENERNKAKKADLFVPAFSFLKSKSLRNV